MLQQSNILVDPDGTDVEEDLQQYGKTSLIMATCNNKLNVAWLLVQHGANLDAVDSTNRTALDWAAILGRHDILQMLTQARINFFGDARGKKVYRHHLKGALLGAEKDYQSNCSRSMRLKNAQNDLSSVHKIVLLRSCGLRK